MFSHIDYIESYHQICGTSVEVSSGRCWDSWQCAKVPQSLDFVNSERAEVSNLLPIDSARFRSTAMGLEGPKCTHPGFKQIKGTLNGLEWFKFVNSKPVEVSTLLPLNALRSAGKHFCNCCLEWDQSTVQNKCVQASFSSMCARFFVKSLAFETRKTGSTCRSVTVQRDVIPLQRPARAKRCWFNFLIGLLSAKHDIPHCGMTNPNGEKSRSCLHPTRGCWTLACRPDLTWLDLKPCRATPLLPRHSCHAAACFDGSHWLWIASLDVSRNYVPNQSKAKIFHPWLPQHTCNFLALAKFWQKSCLPNFFRSFRK